MRHSGMLLRMMISIAMLSLILVADTIAPDPPCVLLCAGSLPNAITQLGLISGNSSTFFGDGSDDGMVAILDPSGSGDIVGVASAHAGTAGASHQTTVAGGQLNNFGTVFASAAVTIDPDFFATASAHTLFNFWLQLVPLPCGSPPLPACPSALIPLTITNRFDIGFQLGGGNAVAQVVVTGGPNMAQQPGLFADELFNPTQTSVSHTVMALPDELFHITMEAKANQFGAGGGIAEAAADPSFQIDPSVPGVDSFSFAVSPDLVPTGVSEPSPLLLLAGCLAIVAWCHRR